MYVPEWLREASAQSTDRQFAVVIEAGGEDIASARQSARELLKNKGALVADDRDGIPADNPFLFARMSGATITALIASPPAFISAIEQDRNEFNKQNLTDSLVLEPLLSKINRKPGESYDIIIDINQNAAAGRNNAIEGIIGYLKAAHVPPGQIKRRPDATHPYIFAKATGDQIRDLAARDQNEARRKRDEDETRRRGVQGQPGAQAGPAPSGGMYDAVVAPLAGYLLIYKISEDAEIHAFITRTVATVKADAAQIAFSARGRDIVWAVMDSGIDASHVHFARHENLVLREPVQHLDFLAAEYDKGQPLTDGFGHGTHVAGILAGETTPEEANAKVQRPVVRAVTKIRNENAGIDFLTSEIRSISGMAPECKLVSMKVLDDRGKGKVSALIEAIEAIQKVNDYGRRVLVDGVNMSLGYEFDPEWFACGQSPLCVEVNRLVKSGVVVVVAAGNTGYGFVNSADRTTAVAAGLSLSINDPGNADLAITVGSTHRYMPHTYGVSYFSSKGPTGDGRSKPDLVAPGEKIISCAAGRAKSKLTASAGITQSFEYLEDSGTSMAAPHVSGVIAAFLSIRPEFRGQPEKLKKVFLDAATDLGRNRAFQGSGLVDLMRAIQSV